MRSRRFAALRPASHRAASLLNATEVSSMKTISPFDGDIAALAERLRQTSIGETVTYESLDGALGRPVRAHRYLLLKARDRVEREDGALFVSVFRTGIKRLPVASYASVGKGTRKAIRRKAARASRRMANGLEHANEAPGEVVRAVLKEQSVLGLIQYASRDSTMKKMLNDEAITAPTPLAVAARGLMTALGVKIED